MPEIVNPETHHEKSDVNVRALQLSQNGTINDLPPDMRAKLAGGAP